MHRAKGIFARFFVVFSCFVAAQAARAQTDIAASGYGAFSQKTSGNGTVQNPGNGAGVLLELRHISNPLVGFEVTYAFSKADQSYSYTPAVCPAFGCTPVNRNVPANAHEVTADYLVSLTIANIRPFVLAGAGLLLDVPTDDTGTSRQTQGVLVYGAGVDVTLLPHLGVRGQYRGNVYQAPQLVNAFSSTKSFTTTAEPMLGVFLRF